MSTQIKQQAKNGIRNKDFVSWLIPIFFGQRPVGWLSVQSSSAMEKGIELILVLASFAGCGYLKKSCQNAKGFGMALTLIAWAIFLAFAFLPQRIADLQAGKENKH